MLKLLHNCTHLTGQQTNAQNSPSQASTVHEPRTSRCSSWIQKRQRNQRSNCQHALDHRESKEPQKNIYLYIIVYTKAFVWITTNCGKLIKRWEYHAILPEQQQQLFCLGFQQLPYWVSPCQENSAFYAVPTLNVIFNVSSYDKFNNNHLSIHTSSSFSHIFVN